MTQLKFLRPLLLLLFLCLMSCTKDEKAAQVVAEEVDRGAFLRTLDRENAPINPIDDSVFEIWFVEGYEGYDGDRGFETAPSKIKFTKQ